MFRSFNPAGHKGPKYAPRGKFGVLAGYFLQPGGRCMGEYLVISFGQLIKATGRIEVKSVPGSALMPEAVTFLLKTVEDIQTDEGLRQGEQIVWSTASCLSYLMITCIRTKRTTVLRLLPVRKSILRPGIALLPIIPICPRAFPCANLVLRGSASREA